MKEGREEKEKGSRKEVQEKYNAKERGEKKKETWSGSGKKGLNGRMRGEKENEGGKKEGDVEKLRMGGRKEEKDTR